MTDFSQNVATQYDRLSAYYKSWFSKPWPAPVFAQGEIIDTLVRTLRPDMPPRPRALDLTCGMGTQSIGLALRGYDVTAIDISRLQLESAKTETAAIDPALSLTWVQGDASSPAEAVQGPFDVIFSFGNSIPLLGTREDIARGFAQAQSLLSPSGLLIVSLRDHEAMRRDRPYVTSNGPLQQEGRKGAWLETAEWEEDGASYRSHIIFVFHEPEREVVHFPFPPIAALNKDETLNLLRKAGFPHVSFHGSIPDISAPVFIAAKEPL